jgi:hypothetical protein
MPVISAQDSRRTLIARGSVRKRVPSFRMGTLPDRFMRKVKKTARGCWLWTGYISPRGYARFTVDGRGVQAHRYAYEILIGPIPAGKEPDHICRRKPCVNPAHLEPVTHAVNMQRALLGLRKRRCPNGHRKELRSDGYTICRQCHNAQAKKRYHRNLEAERARGREKMRRRRVPA